MAAYFPAVPLVVRARRRVVAGRKLRFWIDGCGSTAAPGAIMCPVRCRCASAAFAIAIRNICPNGNMALISITRGQSADGRCGGGDDARTRAPRNRTDPNRPPRSSSPRWPTGDTGGAPPSSATSPPTPGPHLNEAWAGLQASRLDAQILGSKYAEDTGSVAYRYTWHLPKNRTWTYDGQLNMVRDEGRWEVRWSATGLHPRLGEHQTFALRADPPRRASVNERGGTDVLVPGYLYHYALDAKSAGGALMPTATGRGRRAAAVRQHPGPAAARRAGQLVSRTR